MSKATCNIKTFIGTQGFTGVESTTIEGKQGTWQAEIALKQ